MGIEWKRLDHKYFVIDAHLPSGGVSRERKQIHVPTNFEFPTDEEDIDMGNTQPKSNPRQGTSAPPYSKVKKPAYDDRRRSEFLTPPVNIAIVPRIDLPRTRTLLSAILPEK